MTERVTVHRRRAETAPTKAQTPITIGPLSVQTVFYCQIYQNLSCRRDRVMPLSHSKSFEMAPLSRTRVSTCYVWYSTVITYVFLSRTVSEIFSIK